MSSTSWRNAKNYDECEVDEDDKYSHKVDKNVADTPVVLSTGIFIPNCIPWHLSHARLNHFWKYDFFRLQKFLLCDLEFILLF